MRAFLCHGMKLKLAPANAVFLFLVLVSSASAQPVALSRTNAFSRSQSQVLTPNDLIAVDVFQEEEFKQGPRRVAPDGTVTIALLDRIKLGGKTVEEAEKYIREELIAREYLVDPKVTVTVIEHFKWKFTVTGHVQAPGNYEVSGDEKMNLIQALSRAGGITSKGKNKVQVTRHAGGGNQLIDLDAKDPKDQQFQILPDDLITVPEKVF